MGAASRGRAAQRSRIISLEGQIMKRIAIVAVAAVLAACSKGDRTNAMDTTSAGGNIAPAATDTTGMGGSNMSHDTSMGSSNMSSGSNTTSSSNMNRGSSSGATGGAMRSDSSRMGGAAGTSDSVRNQTQSGVTTPKGKSTLGPNIHKTSPTSSEPVTAKGDTLSKAKTPPR
jgi:hypothetical protein